jgi:hypothetical protein
VTLRSVGSAGGQAAAFMYDLARSVVQTRQGNPAWAGQKRDMSTASKRPVDLFYGNAPGDPQPDWLNRDKVAIPQADEQQRLLANLVTLMNGDRAPLPRFWYLPRGERAAVVMTGDDHAVGNTLPQFNAFNVASQPGCSVADWECVRSTSYLWTGTPVTPTNLEHYKIYEGMGFEVALHLETGPVLGTLDCTDYTPESLESSWNQQLALFRDKWPGIAAPRTLRTHCVTWSDWAGEPKAELRHGVRFDTNYYYANANWVQGRPGMFTGSGFPMRFADLDGSIIDVYQAATQMNDESDMNYAQHINALLDGALGPNGYYGVFTVNMHTSFFTHPGAEAVMAAAQQRHVPIVSAAQMLDWVDGRNGSSFQGLSADGGRVRFQIVRAAGARGLEAMVPARSAYGALTALTRDGAPVTTTPRTVKGVEYLVFDAVPGAYVATYPPPPPVTATGGATTGAGRGPTGSGATGGGGKPVKRTLEIRATRRGDVKLPVTCRRTTRACRTTVRLKYRGRTAARKTVRIGAGKRVQVTLRLSRGTRRKLTRSGSLVLTAVITGAGAPTPTQRVRVLAAA